MSVLNENDFQKIELLKEEKSILIDKQAKLQADFIKLSMEKDKSNEFTKLKKLNDNCIIQIITELLLLGVFIFDCSVEFSRYFTSNMLIWLLLMNSLNMSGTFENDMNKIRNQQLNGLSNKNIKRNLSSIKLNLYKIQLEIMSIELRINVIDGELMKMSVNDEFDNIKLLKI